MIGKTIFPLWAFGVGSILISIAFGFYTTALRIV
jgi:hypothetical protein